MTKTATNFLAALMLTFMVGIAFFSMLGDSAIMDEVSHLPAGYSYISQMDMRINPEHPPLVKDLAGGAVWLYSKISGQPINFPYDIDAWKKDINGQWDFGFTLLYKMGNNADLMLLLGRLPMLLVLLLLGFYVFKWTRESFGSLAGLLALFLYSFSPTFLAHGRFITTDVAAAAGIFIASYYFVHWLKNPSTKNLIIAGLVFGVAQLCKFSVFLLVPLFVFIALIWIFLKTRKNNNPAPLSVWLAIKKYFGGLLALFIIGYIFIVWPVYIFHVANYPIAKQVQDTQFILQGFPIKALASFTVWLAGVPVFRAIAYYGLGLAMVFSRATGGNTIYFLGQVINLGSPIYFPLLYLIKEAVSLHVLTLIAAACGFWWFIKKKLFSPASLAGWLVENIASVLGASFIILYWYLSIRSPLNIGIRHVIPTFPFIFMIVAGNISVWLENHHNLTSSRIKYGFISALVVFQIFSVISVYPSFLAYFNEFIGGSQYGYKYVTDSNLDWGQDLKRLSQWTDKNNIGKIYVDYFGGGTPEYYLKENFLPWHCHYRQSEMPQSEWLAVSGTFLQIGRGEIKFDYNGYAHCYDWLNGYQPTTVIGNSIFIYKIPKN